MSVKFSANLVIPTTKLRWREKIGEGGCGEVYRVIHEDWGPLAIKKLSIHMMVENEKVVVNLQREAQILSELRHTNVIQFSGVVWEPPHFGLAMPLAAHGSLASFISQETVPWPLKLNFAYQAACGMSYLISLPKPVLHGDLKISNILLEEGLVVKVSDFGLSQWRAYQTTVSNSKFEISKDVSGTITHIAPESLEDAELTLERDVYAFAIFLWELFSGDIPFKGLQQIQVMFTVMRGKRPDVALIPPDLPICIRNLITECWAQEPNERPQFPHIRQTLHDVCEEDDMEISDTRMELLSDIHRKTTKKKMAERSPVPTPRSGKSVTTVSSDGDTAPSTSSHLLSPVDDSPKITKDKLSVRFLPSGPDEGGDQPAGDPICDSLEIKVPQLKIQDPEEDSSVPETSMRPDYSESYSEDSDASDGEEPEDDPSVDPIYQNVNAATMERPRPPETMADDLCHAIGKEPLSPELETPMPFCAKIASKKIQPKDLVTLNPAGVLKLEQRSNHLVALGYNGEVVMADNDGHMILYRFDGSAYLFILTAPKPKCLTFWCRKQMSQDGNLFLQANSEEVTQKFNQNFVSTGYLKQPGELVSCLPREQLVYSQRHKKMFSEERWRLVVYDADKRLMLNPPKRLNWDRDISVCSNADIIAVVKSEDQTLDILTKEGHLMVHWQLYYKPNVSNAITVTDSGHLIIAEYASPPALHVHSTKGEHLHVVEHSQLGIQENDRIHAVKCSTDGTLHLVCGKVFTLLSLHAYRLCVLMA